MAKVGLRYPVFAPITNENDGAMPTYGAGIVMGHAISADLSFTRSQVKLYADDRVVESDNSITGGTVTMGTDDLTDEVQVAVLGTKEKTVTGGKEYEETGEAAPYGGFGYIRVQQLGGSIHFIGYWLYKVIFSAGDESAATKGETTEWQTPTITGEVMGVDNGGDMPAFRVHASFDSFAAAKAWVDAKAHMSA